MKKVNIVLAIISVFAVILSMLVIFGTIKSKVTPPIFFIIGLADLINGILCKRREENKEFKIFLISGVFLLVIALFSQF